MKGNLFKKFYRKSEEAFFIRFNGYLVGSPYLRQNQRFNYETTNKCLFIINYEVNHIIT